MLPGVSGLDLFERIRRIDERVPVIFITASGESDTAIEAMKLGALDFLLKPLDVGRVRELVAQALRIRGLMETPVELPKPAGGSDSQLVGRSQQMLEVYKAIGRVAPQTVTVLIVGESGTGKELIARAIYQHSERKTKPFLAVNCAALPRDASGKRVVRSRKRLVHGGRSSADWKVRAVQWRDDFSGRSGRYAAADAGQATALLQEQRFERVGGNETIQTDVRIITATNRDLEAMIAAGTFRPDLYYRLNGFTIKAAAVARRGRRPAVADRGVPPRISQELNKPLQRVSPEAMKILVEYDWPGNIREMQSMLRKVAAEFERTDSHAGIPAG